VFWRSTARECVAYAEAVAAQRGDQRALALFTAWWAAAFARQEELPDLAVILARVSGEDTMEQDPEEQMNVARAILASFSGSPDGEA
jgi:hypothetical protein